MKVIALLAVPLVPYFVFTSMPVLFEMVARELGTLVDLLLLSVFGFSLMIGSIVMPPIFAVYTFGHFNDIGGWLLEMEQAGAKYTAG